MKILLALLASTSLLCAAGEYSNRRAPGFSLPDSTFAQHDLQDFRGRVLIIEIMSTGCPTCARLTDLLVQVKEKIGDKLGIVSVMTLPDNFERANQFAAEHNVHWPIVFDSGQMIMSYLKVMPSNPQIHFPHLFVIDPAGTIRNDWEGIEDKDLTPEGLSAIVTKLLK